MVSKILSMLSAIVLTPLAILIVLFAVANREPVTISFDPFNAAAPAYTMRVPLFTVFLLLLIAGVIIGGIAAWLRQRKWRRTARRLQSEVRALRAELDGASRTTARRERSGLPARLDVTPPLIARPPSA
jgi:uncharacterized integral membrane protein